MSNQSKKKKVNTLLGNVNSFVYKSEHFANIA